MSIAEVVTDATSLADGTTTGEDADNGQFFDVPRIAVVIDETDPSALTIALSGSITLDRSKKNDVDFYNSLIAGKTTDLEIEAHVAGAKRTQRRDKEGNVDAIVETKSLVVHSIVNT